MEAANLAETARQAAEAAAAAATAAQEAALNATLDSIVTYKDFAAKTNTRSEANTLKCHYIKKFGLPKWSDLIGRSR